MLINIAFKYMLKWFVIFYHYSFLMWMKQNKYLFIFKIELYFTKISKKILTLIGWYHERKRTKSCDFMIIYDRYWVFLKNVYEWMWNIKANIINRYWTGREIKIHVSLKNPIIGANGKKKSHKIYSERHNLL